MANNNVYSNAKIIKTTDKDSVQGYELGTFSGTSTSNQNPQMQNVAKLNENEINGNTDPVFLFLMLLGIILIYKKRTKPSREELKKKRVEQRNYILHKIKEMQQKRKREHNEIITNLPTFESNFETLHKNYYKI